MTLVTYKPEYAPVFTEDMSSAIDYLYTSQHEAREELIKRRKNQKLKLAVRRGLHPSFNTVAHMFESPKAVMFRQVATPTHEILRFIRMAKHMKLTPVILEYYGDKFVSAGNPYKRSLGKMPIYQHTGIDGRDIVHYRNIVDFNAYTGKPLSAVQCKDGTTLIRFHHILLNQLARFSTEKQCVDATEWFEAMGDYAQGYYRQFLTLFVRDAILFEYIDPAESEQQFARDVMIPAFHSVEAQYAHRPLIVRLVPKNKEARQFWDSFPKKTESLIK